MTEEKLFALFQPHLFLMMLTFLSVKKQNKTNQDTARTVQCCVCPAGGSSSIFKMQTYTLTYSISTQDNQILFISISCHWDIPGLRQMFNHFWLMWFIFSNKPSVLCSNLQCFVRTSLEENKRSADLCMCGNNIAEKINFNQRRRHFFTVLHNSNNIFRDLKCWWEQL